ncbi:MAG: hypothetical protein ACI9CO_000041 [Candidatus Azotimanducaceae bacterium]|jgi:hypothetical protein
MLFGFFGTHNRQRLGTGINEERLSRCKRIDVTNLCYSLTSTTFKNKKFNGYFVTASTI